MRPFSKKRRQKNQAAEPIREAYRIKFRHCMVCGKSPADAHEISSGTAGRPLSIDKPETWLAACYSCNCFKLTDKKEYPVARQLAIKLIHDPENFDLEVFNGCYAGTVNLGDVSKWLELAEEPRPESW